MKLGSRTSLQTIRRRSVDVTVELTINGSEAPIEETFRLREMSGTERDRFEIAAFKEADGKRVVDPLYLRARLVALCMVGEDGARLYADDEIHQLSDEVPASVIAKLFEAAQKLNGLDAAAVEDAAKNSASAPAGASSSA